MKNWHKTFEITAVQWSNGLLYMPFVLYFSFQISFKKYVSQFCNYVCLKKSASWAMKLSDFLFTKAMKLIFVLMCR